MKLEELLGIKKYADKEFDPLNREMRTKFWQRPKTINDVMAKAGWLNWSNGVSSSLYRKTGKNYVIKVFKNDEGYKVFLKYALDNQQNKHLPKIGKVFSPFKEKNICVVQLEYLNDNNNKLDLDLLLTEIFKYINKYAYPSNEEIKSIYDKQVKPREKTEIDEDDVDSKFVQIDIIANLLKKLSKNNVSLSLFETLFQVANIAIINGFNVSALDLHSGNILYRGAVPVIIDPFYDWDVRDVKVQVRSTQPFKNSKDSENENK